MSIIPLQNPQSRNNEVIKAKVTAKFFPSLVRNKPSFRGGESTVVVESVAGVFICTPEHRCPLGTITVTVTDVNGSIPKPAVNAAALKHATPMAFKAGVSTWNQALEMSYILIYQL
jgi:hypothetical protein